MKTVNTEILNEIVEQAAKFQYESYGSLATYHAFLMGLGEVEARLLTDIDLSITQEIDKAINERVQALGADMGILDHEVTESLYRGKQVIAHLAGEMRSVVIIDLLPHSKKILVETYCPNRQEFELAEGEWQDTV